jgi:CBS domain-containing protein
MIDRRVNRLPVVEDGRLVGIVSIRDVMRVALDDSSPKGA